MPRRRSSSRSRSKSSSSSSCSSSRSSSGHDRRASGSQGGGSGRNRYQSRHGRRESSTKKVKKRSRTRDDRSPEDRRRRKSSNKSKKDHNHHQRRRRRHGSRRRSTTRSRSRSRSASPPKKSRKDRRRSRSRSRDRRRRSPDRRTADRPSPSTTRASLEVPDRPVPVSSEISKPKVDAHESAIEQTRRERAIANIESSSGFAPASFVSSAKGKVASIALPGEAPPAMTSGLEFGTAFEKNEAASASGSRLLEQMTADGLCHPSLFGGEAEKEARWVRHLFQLRKNLMQTGI